MKKILVPCDFSFYARQAYKFALDIAAANSGELLVLHVSELPVIYGNGMAGQPYSYVDPVFDTGDSKDDLNKQFEFLKHSFDKPLVPVRFCSEIGIVSDLILKNIEEHQIDLVVMGTSGASGIKEFFIGSNTEKIVRSATVPVFAVHKAQPLSDIKNIVFPTDLDFNQHGLIEKIKTLQSFFNAELYLLYVKTPGNPLSDAEAVSDMKSYAKFYSLDHYTVNVRHQQHEQQGILEFAGELKQSVIAMATHGHKGITHLLWGSVVEDVVNHAHEQVWTYAIGDN